MTTKSPNLCTHLWSSRSFRQLGMYHSGHVLAVYFIAVSLIYISRMLQFPTFSICGWLCAERRFVYERVIICKPLLQTWQFVRHTYAQFMLPSITFVVPSEIFEVIRLAVLVTDSNRRIINSHHLFINFIQLNHGYVSNLGT